jgi:hypothetical protein
MRSDGLRPNRSDPEQHGEQNVLADLDSTFGRR